MAAVLALLALAAQTKLGIALVWLFNLWGTGDLLYAFYQGNRVEVEPGTTWCHLLHRDCPRAAALHHALARV